MKIKLINYQAHADSELDVVPGINVIVGRSDSGKSSVIRAVEAVANGGVMDKRHGTKQAEVHIDDCRRVRSGTKNSFELGTKVFKAMRTETPREIVDTLNLSDVNFRPQHSPYFLLSDSPGAVARSMNEFADLGLIDFVVGRAKAEAKTAADAVKRLQLDLEDAQAKARALDWAVEADVMIQTLEGLEFNELQLSTQLKAVEETVAQIGEVEQWLVNSAPSVSSTDVGAIVESLSSTEIDEVEATVWITKNLEAELAKLPEIDVQPLTYAIDRLNAVVDPGPVQALVESIAEVEAELKLVPDIEGAIGQLILMGMDIMDFDDTESIESVISMLEELPDNSEILARLIIFAAKAESLITSPEDNDVGLIIQLCRTLPCYEGDIKNLRSEIDWMNADYKKLLTDAGVCPTCGGKV